jgi:hypothetical protein
MPLFRALAKNMAASYFGKNYLMVWLGVLLYPNISNLQYELQF